MRKLHGRPKTCILQGSFNTNAAMHDTFTFIDDIALIGSLGIKRYALDNGLQVAIVVDRTSPVFTYQTWFRTGSADEEAGRQGLAHLFEHMMFRETRNRGLGEFDRLVNLHGGSGMNAYTSRDQTVYHYTFPNDKLEIAVDLEADRMVNLVIDEGTFETEKGAVLTEKNRGLDDPMRYLWEEVYRLAYTSHTYKYSTIGEVDSIKSFSVGEAQAFYRNYYAPNNALIIVVGDVDPEAVVRTISLKYGPIAPQPVKARPAVTDPPQRESREAVLTHAKATRRMLAVVHHIPNMSHPDYPALATLGKLLSAGKSAVLKERLLHTSMVTSLFADAYVCKDLGTFEFFAQLADGVRYEDVQLVYRRALEECAAGAISGDQLAVVKNEMERDLYQSATNPDALGQKLGDAFINTGDLAFQVKALEAILRVDAGHIGEVVRRYLLESPSTTVRLDPAGARS